MFSWIIFQSICFFSDRFTFYRPKLLIGIKWALVKLKLAPIAGLHICVIIDDFGLKDLTHHTKLGLTRDRETKNERYCLVLQYILSCIALFVVVYCFFLANCVFCKSDHHWLTRCTLFSLPIIKSIILRYVNISCEMLFLCFVIA